MFKFCQRNVLCKLKKTAFRLSKWLMSLQKRPGSIDRTYRKKGDASALRIRPIVVTSLVFPLSWGRADHAKDLAILSFRNRITDSWAETTSIWPDSNTSGRPFLAARDLSRQVA